MSNDKAPKRELAISVVRFRGLVDIGIRAEESWQAVGGGENVRKTRVEELPDRLKFIYEAGDDYQETDVFHENIGSIKRILKSKLEALKAKGSL